jgi:DedD protein
MRTTDAELFKEKIEVSLDGRQIFYLFFGGAVIASLVFVLGVMVGKRVEARQHVGDSAHTSAALDPLAALDQLGAEQELEELAFPRALAGGALARDESAVPPVPVPEQRRTNDSPPEPVPNRLAADKAAPSGAADKAAPSGAADKAAPSGAADKAAPSGAAADKTGPAAGKAALVPNAEATPKADASAGTARFTLQLSSFQDRTEADEFQAKIRAAGYQPYLTEADVPDKGVWYRVRLGKYVSHSDALAAKAEFEKRMQIIAYVTRLR